MLAVGVSSGFPRIIRPLLVYAATSFLGVSAGGAVALAISPSSVRLQPLSIHRVVGPLNSASTRLPLVLPSLSDVPRLLSTDTADRWSIIGGALLQARLSRLSAAALKHAVARDGYDSTLHVALGEAIVLSNDGQVVDAAKKEFDRVLSADPNDLIARYYMAHWLLQNGKPKLALVKLVGLMRTVGNDPVWYASLWRVMPQAAEQVGVDRLALEALCVAGM